MIGIHIVSHGDLCSGILDSLSMIVGRTSHVNYTKLKEAADIDEFKEEMLRNSRALNSGQGVLVFADMYGATPCNTALFNSREFEADMYAVVAGFNLPILIDALVSRESMSLPELVESIKSNGHTSIVVPKISK